jgi:hypothetical protein
MTKAQGSLPARRAIDAFNNKDSVIDLFHGVDDMRAMRLERKLIIPSILHLHLIPDFLGLCGPF